MSETNEHGAQDYEHVWPPYGVAIPGPAPAVCVWRYVDDGYGEYWQSDCNELTVVCNDASPAVNGWRFCAYCGKPLRAVHP